MLSDLITAPFCKAGLTWLSMVADVPALSIDELCSLGEISKLLCRFLAAPPPVAFDHEISAVKRARKLYGHNTYQVSELLQNQAKALGELVLMHLSEARARGANAMVNARLASIHRSLNFERLAIFMDKEQVLFVMELLVRIGTQTAQGREWARQKFACLPKHQRDAVHLYLEATIEQVNAEDTPLARIEEMRRHVNVQLAQQSMGMEEELRRHRARIAEMLEANKKLRRINNRARGDALSEQVELLQWDLSLIENVVASNLWTGTRP
ncbi:hypothetical protein OXX80_011130 [Metschnikowia pulcherrima]